MDIDQIRAHIDSLIKQKNKNYRSLSLAIGKNEAYLHQFVNKGSPLRLPETERRKLAELLEVDEQELTDIVLPVAGHQSADRNTALIEMVSNDETNFSNSKTTGYISLPITDLTHLSSALPQSLKMFRILGDSMYPTLKDGDYVFFDTSHNTYSIDGLYLIEMPNGWQIRRIQQISSSECAVISDNTNYSNLTYHFKKLKIIGKVVFAFKTEKLI